MAYNKATTQNKAKYFDSKDELLELLRSVDKIELKKIGSKMKSVAEENYTWGKISEQYSELF